MDLERELACLLNRHSAENPSNTPDYLLAEFMLSCLRAFTRTVTGRDAWYAMNPEPGKDWHANIPEQPRKPLDFGPYAE